MYENFDSLNLDRTDLESNIDFFCINPNFIIGITETDARAILDKDDRFILINEKYYIKIRIIRMTVTDNNIHENDIKFIKNSLIQNETFKFSLSSEFNDNYVICSIIKDNIKDNIKYFFIINKKMLSGNFYKLKIQAATYNNLVQQTDLIGNVIKQNHVGSYDFTSFTIYNNKTKQDNLKSKLFTNTIVNEQKNAYIRYLNQSTEDKTTRIKRDANFSIDSLNI